MVYDCSSHGQVNGFIGPVMSSRLLNRPRSPIRQLLMSVEIKVSYCIVGDILQDQSVIVVVLRLPSQADS